MQYGILKNLAFVKPGWEFATIKFAMEGKKLMQAFSPYSKHADFLTNRASFIKRVIF